MWGEIRSNHCRTNTHRFLNGQRVACGCCRLDCHDKFHKGMLASEPRVFHLISCHRVGTSALGTSPTLGFIPPFFLAAFSFVGFPTTVGWRASCRWSILGGPEVQVPISPRTERDIFDRDLGALACSPTHLGLGSRPCVAFPLLFRSSFRTWAKPNHPIRVSLGRTASPHPRDLVSDHREQGPFHRDLLGSTSIPSSSPCRVPQEIDPGYADWTGGSPHTRSPPPTNPVATPVHDHTQGTCRKPSRTTREPRTNPRTNVRRNRKTSQEEDDRGRTSRGTQVGVHEAIHVREIPRRRSRLRRSASEEGG